MEYSNGMGVEMPVWVIQSTSGKRTFNKKTHSFQQDVTEACVYNTPTEAAEQLKMLDFGYVVKPKRHYQDLNNNRIW